MKEINVTVIGSGSTYCPELVDGFLQRQDSLKLKRLVLMDIDDRKRNIVGSLCERMIKAAGMDTEVVMTDNLDEALPGADFVTEETGETFPNQWTVRTAETGANFVKSGTSCLVSGILKNEEGVTDEQNSARGKMDIFANAYVKVTVGDQVVTLMTENTTEVAFSMMSVMKTLDTRLAAELQAYADGTGELSETAQKALAFYKSWTGAMADWELDNMALAAEVA